MGLRVNVAKIALMIGQDGAYLAKLILRKGYEIHDVNRLTLLLNTACIDHLYQDPHMGNRDVAARVVG
jgi:GDPmannose 4,6-dehydratase